MHLFEYPQGVQYEALPRTVRISKQLETAATLGRNKHEGRSSPLLKKAEKRLTKKELRFA